VTDCYPTLEAVEAIAAVVDPVERNERITRCYHELAVALARLDGAGGANWCAFATWASKQAGVTIRGEDARRTFEDLVRRSPAVAAAVDVVIREAGRLGVSWSRAGLLRVVLDAVDAEGATRRAGAAVARGNLKVFAEIGREFARFLAARGDGVAPDAAAMARFLAELRPGAPPDGQSMLRAAFDAYDRARFGADPRTRAQLLVHANLLVGYHEQLRLQPLILEAMNAAIADPSVVRRRVLAALLPASWLRVRVAVARFVGRELPLDRLLDALIELTRQQLREVITRSLMTIRISEGPPLRLGREIPGASPPELDRPELPGLRELLDSIGGAGTGVAPRDWGDFSQRMRFIARLFQLLHGSPTVFDPPSPGPRPAPGPRVPA
jgi:hypothetical protein